MEGLKGLVHERPDTGNDTGVQISITFPPNSPICSVQKTEGFHRTGLS